MANEAAFLIFEKTISSPIAKVEDVLFDIHPGDFNNENAPVVIAGTGEGKITWEGNHFQANYKDGHNVYLSVDKSQHQLSVEGEWWYRGVYLLTEQNGIAKLIFEVRNIAPRFHWIASLMQWNKKKIYESGFAKLIETLEKRLA